MYKKKFSKLANDLLYAKRKLGEFAEELIRAELVKRGNLSKKDLFGEDDDYDRIWLEGYNYLDCLLLDDNHRIKVGKIDEYGDLLEEYVDTMSMDDRIEIADYLCQIFPD